MRWQDQKEEKNEPGLHVDRQCRLLFNEYELAAFPFRRGDGTQEGLKKSK